MNDNFEQKYAYISDKIVRALNFAARAHRTQLRRDTFKTPYIAHPAGVGLILSQTGCAEEVVIAGILHDVIEDTEFGYEEIKTEFGEPVADLVQWVSIPKGLTGRAGKEAYLDNLEKAPAEAKLISAADMLYNRIDLVYSVEHGETIEKFASTISPELNDRRISIIESNLGANHALVKDLKSQREYLQKYFENGQHTSRH